MRRDCQIVRSIHLWHGKCKVTIKANDKSLVLSGGQMRSDLVYGAIKQVSNRFLLAKGLAKATREFHRPGTSIEDTINDVLVRCSSSNPIVDGNAVRNSTTPGSRRSRQRPVVVHRTGIFSVPPVSEGSHAQVEPSY